MKMKITILEDSVIESERLKNGIRKYEMCIRDRPKDRNNQIKNNIEYKQSTRYLCEI